MRLLLAPCVVAAVLSGPAFSQGAPNEAVPTSAWTVDFAGERCVALRQYATPAGPVVLALEPSPDRDGMRIIFRVPARKDEPYGSTSGRLSINGVEQKWGYVMIWPAAKDGLLIYSGSRGDDREPAMPLPEVKSLSLATARLSVTLPVSGADKVATVLDECTRDLLKSWGFALAEQDRLATWPKHRNAQTMLTYVDYPPESMLRGEQGEVRVRGVVGANGKLKDCKVRYSSGYPRLDAVTCDLLRKRGKFEPARDKAGQPMDAPTFTSVRWIMPTV